VGQEVVEAGGGLGADAAQDVREVGDGLDAIGLAGGGEGVEAGEVGPGLFVSDDLRGHPKRATDGHIKSRPPVEALRDVHEGDGPLVRRRDGKRLEPGQRQQVVALGRLGWSLRRIEAETGVRRETASGYLRVAGVAV